MEKRAVLKTLEKNDGKMSRLEVTRRVELLVRPKASHRLPARLRSIVSSCRVTTA